MSDYIEKAIKVLKKNNLRVTKPRKLVIKLLNNSNEALSAYEIKDKLENKVDIVSIYRIIECLENNKLVHRVLSSSKVMKCQLQHEDDCKHKQEHHCHHLLICNLCGTIREIHCEGVNSLIKSVEKNLKFKIKTHNLEFYGTCPKCD